MSRRSQTVLESVAIPRPAEGWRFTASHPGCPLPLNGQPAWVGRDSALDVQVSVPLVRVHLVGVFALDSEPDSPGSIGAKVQFRSPGHPLTEIELVKGRHYGEMGEPARATSLFGDGSSVATLGTAVVGQSDARVDVLTIDVPNDNLVDRFTFRACSPHARFVIFDVFFETSEIHGCPFHQRGGGVPLADVATAVRLGDRVKLNKALVQLDAGIRASEDLDEARGQALTFLAVVTSAMLELGGGREMHRVQLDAARAMDRLASIEAVVISAREWVEKVAASVFETTDSPSAYLVDRALAIVERNFAKEITDGAVASQLGLSTSHFRFLFRQATGQPFHKYLIALRLEKGKRMLVEQELAVSEVARAVGFAGLSHFSRAFTQRFQASPTTFRRGVQ